MQTPSNMTVLERLSAEAKRRTLSTSQLFRSQPKLLAMLAVGGMIFVGGADVALAGTEDDGEFEDIWDTLVGWTQGTLGRIIALTLIIVGAAMGVVRQSLITFVVGIAMGLALYNAPTIIENIMTGTLDHLVIQAEHLLESGLGNGLK